MRGRGWGWLGLIALVPEPAPAWEPVSVPAAVRRALPQGHVARLATCSRSLDPPRTICLVVAARPEEGEVTWAEGRTSPPRPLLVYRLTAGRATLVARNDRVVLHRDDGGQCDPIEDGGALVVKGRFFTLESGVACGQHWTDYTTLRFDPQTRGFVWSSTIRESWKPNDGVVSGDDALVLDGRSVRRADPRRPVGLAAYTPH